MYRRIVKNPNFYEIAGRSPQHINDFLSELVEDTIGELEEAGCVNVSEDEMELEPTNVLHVGAYYNLHFQTLRLFAHLLASSHDGKAPT